MISLDDDESDVKAAFNWWLKQFPKAITWPVIEGKDPTEAYMNGLDLREWGQAGIKDSLSGAESSIDIAEDEQFTTL